MEWDQASAENFDAYVDSTMDGIYKGYDDYIDYYETFLTSDILEIFAFIIPCKEAGCLSYQIELQKQKIDPEIFKFVREIYYLTTYTPNGIRIEYVEYWEIPDSEFNIRRSLISQRQKLIKTKNFSLYLELLEKHKWLMQENKEYIKIPEAEVFSLINEYRDSLPHDILIYTMMYATLNRLTIEGGYSISHSYVNHPLLFFSGEQVEDIESETHELLKTDLITTLNLNLSDKNPFKIFVVNQQKSNNFPSEWLYIFNRLGEAYDYYIFHYGYNAEEKIIIKSENNFQTIILISKDYLIKFEHTTDEDTGSWLKISGYEIEHLENPIFVSTGYRMLFVPEYNNSESSNRNEEISRLHPINQKEFSYVSLIEKGNSLIQKYC